MNLTQRGLNDFHLFRDEAKARVAAEAIELDEGETAHVIPMAGDQFLVELRHDGEAFARL